MIPSRLMPVILGAAFLLSFVSARGDTTAETVETFLEKARTAFTSGKTAEALEFANQAIAKDPGNANALYVRGRIHEAARRLEEAISDYDAVLKKEPEATGVYQRRGELNFRLGRFAESVADFDRFLKSAPREAPNHWQRGISLYYAKRFEDGKKQFELHQTVNSNDVENAVWHFLCAARADGLEKARAGLIPIGYDRRVPMMEVYSLFKGQGTPQKVLDAAREGNPSPEELKQRLFYAHLYLGLYHDAVGDRAAALEHIQKAAGEFYADHYMGEVARVHETILRKEAAAPR